jgi:hypothetical protein
MKKFILGYAAGWAGTYSATLIIGHQGKGFSPIKHLARDEAIYLAGACVLWPAILPFITTGFIGSKIFDVCPYFKKD